MSSFSSDQSNGLSSLPVAPTGKPPNPYVVGASFVAMRHQPPAPYGGIYSDDFIPYFDGLPNSDHFEWCKSHPPAQGLTLLEDRQCITITDIIRTGDDCGAQVLLTDTGLVAKIYDPLYYEFHLYNVPRRKLDCVALADSEYSIEAAAYMEVVDPDIQGSVIPKYFGSWTLDITQRVRGAPVTRAVRMILVEYVPGVRMLDLDPDDLTKEERENIMRKVIEADYDLRLAGVQHYDLEPRNIIIDNTSNYAAPNMRVTLIDYGCSLVDRIYWGRPTPRHRYNPCFGWSGASRWSQWGWLPWEDEDRISWVWAMWGDGSGGKYVKVERDPDSPLGRPKRIPVE
ncbi:uncharacterized protein K460DRAFT_275757 [Cucurbitaria berberidis CBS 394.84]|uniref:Protein kinase domain-containing protein n=1 Tax=Cucurbitaria berberidis CBS 394.84 TaxID=1168544 RepID=A0A9P4GP73_9PLEO|nr:uncharacterized protein K460DRAFT_275757 [Cucurbitaria berberidis CBS 394.84]KAF1848881.1 hypothetical protein K460DRAFT_275757 [Cucurbitaria berberidis CBS 394.84]